MSHDFAAKRMKMCHKRDDTSYFSSYADIAVHEEMLSDEVRTNAYKKAIFDCEDRFKDKVVLDVGAGTAILSIFCAKAGAKKVYAVEASNIAAQAQKIVKLNGVADRVQVIQGVLEDVILPEKVDIIVSEWMGYCLLYESMLSSVIIARDRWLKEGGLILPSAASIHLAPICDEEIINEKVNFWNDMKESYGVDMSCLKDFARKSFAKEVTVKSISCENVLSQSSQLVNFDLYAVQQEQLNSVAGDFAFKSFGMADLQGFALWFDVTFPSSHCAGFRSQRAKPQPVMKSSNGGSCKNPTIGEDEKVKANGNRCDTKQLRLSTSPYHSETHWKQAVLYLEQEQLVEQDTPVEASIKLTPNASNKRFLDIELKFRVNGDAHQSRQTFLMGYETPAITAARKSEPYDDSRV